MWIPCSNANVNGGLCEYPVVMQMSMGVYVNTSVVMPMSMGVYVNTL